MAEIRQLQGGRIIVSTDGGEERNLPLRAASAFDVGRLRSIEVATGDKVLIRANRKRLGLINGQVLTVRHVEADGSLATSEGITIPPTFRQWCHGYVVTSHKAQGRTCEHVVVAAERLDAKAAYVACSRGRKSCAIHTPDKQRLIERLPPGSRKAVLDVLEENRQGIPVAIVQRAPVWIRLFGQTVTRKIATAQNGFRRLAEQARRTTVRWSQFHKYSFAHSPGHVSRIKKHHTVKTANYPKP